MKKLLLSLSIFCFTSSSWAQWQNSQAIQHVLGAPGLGEPSDRTCTDRTLGTIGDIAIDEQNGKLYVSDPFYRRVLRFQYPLIEDFPAAELVFGQDDFTSAVGSYNPNISNFFKPTGLFVDQLGSLYVCDEYYRRVLRFDLAYLLVNNNPTATAVYGQNTFLTTNNTWAEGGFYMPSDVVSDGLEHMYVADEFRVLRFDGIRLNPIQPLASVVFGSSGFDQIRTGEDLASFGSSVKGLDLYNDTLVVSDYGNKRLLYFSDASTTSSNPLAKAAFDICPKEFNPTIEDYQDRSNERNYAYPVKSSTKGSYLAVASPKTNKIALFNRRALDGFEQDDTRLFFGISSGTKIPYADQYRFRLDNPSTVLLNETGNMLLVGEENTGRVFQYQKEDIVTSTRTLQVGGASAIHGTNIVSTTLYINSQAARSIQIADPTGRVVLEQTENNSGTIDVSALPSGMYFGSYCTSSDKQRQKFKFVIE